MQLPPGARTVIYIAFSFPEEIPADLLKFIYDATYITLVVDGQEIAAASMFTCKPSPPHSRRFVWQCETKVRPGSQQVSVFLQRHTSQPLPNHHSGFFIHAEICIDGMLEPTSLGFERREPARHVNN